MESRRFLVAAVLSLAVLVLWQWIFPPPPPVRPAGGEEDPLEVSSVFEEGSGVSSGVGGEAPEATSLSGTQGALGEDDPSSQAVFSDEGTTLEPDEAVRPAPRERIAALEEEVVVLETEDWEAHFSNRGAVLESLVLKQRIGADGLPLEMVRIRRDSDLGVFSLLDEGGAGHALNQELFRVERSSTSVTFEHVGDAGEARKTFAIRPAAEGSFLDVEVEHPSAGWSVWLGPGVRNPPWSELEDRFQKRFRDVTYRVGASTERVIADKVEVAERIDATGVEWFSLQDKYFLIAVVPTAGLRSAVVLPVALDGDKESGLQGFEPLRTAEEESRPIDLALALEPSGDRLDLSTYWSPKQYVELKRLEAGLEETVHWGRLGFIARPLLYGLRWLHENVTTNYGWCIVLMTLLLRIGLLPLTHTSFVSMQKMAQLNPQMEAIRAKYRPKLKDKKGRPNLEQQRLMNEEIQKLFKQEKVNPAAGCLPLLLQMPIFFAFYQLLVQAVELWGAPWVLWIQDLSVRDPIYVLPLVMGGTQLLQQKFMPASPNPTQRMIMNTMPIFFTVFALNFPSGLVLYWLTNNILTIFQQAGYNRLKKAGMFGGETPSASREKK